MPSINDALEEFPVLLLINDLRNMHPKGAAAGQKKLPFVRPAEMIAVELPASMLTGGELVFKLAKGE